MRPDSCGATGIFGGAIEIFSGATMGGLMVDYRNQAGYANMVRANAKQD